MDLLRKGNYVRISHLEVKSVHHLAGIYQCQRSKATTSSVSGFSLNEFPRLQELIILFKSSSVAYTSIFNHKHSVGHKHIPVQFLHQCLLKNELNC